MGFKAPVRCVRHFSSYCQDYKQLKTSLDALQVAHLAGESIGQAVIEAGEREREERVVGNLRACGGGCLVRACLGAGGLQLNAHLSQVLLSHLPVAVCVSRLGDVQLAQPVDGPDIDNCPGCVLYVCYVCRLLLLLHLQRLLLHVDSIRFPSTTLRQLAIANRLAINYVVSLPRCLLLPAATSSSSSSSTSSSS